MFSRSGNRKVQQKYEETPCTATSCLSSLTLYKFSYFLLYWILCWKNMLSWAALTLTSTLNSKKQKLIDEKKHSVNRKTQSDRRLVLFHFHFPTFNTHLAIWIMSNLYYILYGYKHMASTGFFHCPNSKYLNGPQNICNTVFQVSVMSSCVLKVLCVAVLQVWCCHASADTAVLFLLLLLLPVLLLLLLYSLIALQIPDLTWREKALSFKQPPPPRHKHTLAGQSDYSRFLILDIK